MDQPSSDRLALLYRISQTFNSSLDLAEVLNRVMDEVIAATNAERGFLMLREPDGRMAFKAARGLDRTTIESPEFEVSRGVVERVANEGRSILTSDAQNEEWLSSRMSVRALNLRAVLAVPLEHKGEIKGVVYVDNRLQSGIFSPDDIELIEGIAASAAIAIENARLYQVAVEKGRMERELQVARDVQANLIPQQTPHMSGWEFAALWRPARRVSGDFYDFIPLPNSGLGVVIADVTDKGMPAALFMAHARSILRASVSGPFPPAKAITTANRLICTDPTEGMFVSLYYVNIQPERDELICVNAGHNPPYHFNAKEKSLSELPRGGMPLGIEETTEYQELAVPFQPGDFMLLYTDGVTEASNRELHFFGTDRLNKILSKNQKGSPEKIRTAIDAAVSHFMGTTNPSDDITLVVIKRG